MTDETTPPAPQAGDGGANPQPQAGNPQPTPQAGSGKTPDDYERMLAELRKENAGHRTKLKKFEDDETQRAQAQLSEVERLKKQHDDLKSQHDTLTAELRKSHVYQEVARHASKLNFLVSGETLAKLLLNDVNEIEFENDSPTNIEKLLEKLAKAEPDLVKQEPQQQRPPALPANNPGRTTYGQPGGTTQGKPGRWEEVQWSR